MLENIQKKKEGKNILRVEWGIPLKVKMFLATEKKNLSSCREAGEEFKSRNF